MAKNPTYFVNQIDVPGAAFSWAVSVTDDGVVLGEYQLPRIRFDNTFSDTNGVITDGWTGQGETTHDGFTYFTSHIDGAWSAGDYWNTDFSVRGMFVSHGGTTQSFQDYHATDINSHGTVVGQGTTGGFIESAGKFTDLGTNYTPIAINENSEVVGNTADGKGFFDAHGHVTTFILPGVNGTVVGVADGGLIAGSFSDGMREHGFLYQPNGHQMSQFDVPGYGRTYLESINDAGEIAGYATADVFQAPSHGFVAQTDHAVGFGTPIGTETPVTITPPKLVG